MKKQENKRKTGIPRLLELAGRKKYFVIGSGFFGVLTSLVQFIPFVAAYKILEELTAHAAMPSMANEEAVWFWCWIMFWAFIASIVFNFCSLALSHLAAFNILYELRIQLSQKLARLPLGYFTKNATGKIKKIMTEDVERLEIFIAHNLPDTVSAFLFPILLFVYMLWVNWLLALAVFSVVVIAVVFMSRMYTSDRVRGYIDGWMRVTGQVNASLVEYIRGIQVIKIFTKSTKAYHQLNHDVAEFRTYATKMNQSYQGSYVGFHTILLSTIVLVLPVGAFMLMRAESYAALLPQVLLFLVFAVGIFFPLLKVMWIASLLNQNSMGIAEIDAILYEKELTEPTEPKKPTEATVAFENVTFAYEEKEVLKEISFTAAPGTITALVGPSGAGKSTIAMLTARFWDIDDGDIKIGNIPLKEITTTDLMNQIAFVFQDNPLFFDTIEENIRMGNKTATTEQVEAAAKAAQCHNFIMALPQGYKTLVGEGGTYLSGGEQQRLALARAILKDAPIILLDEATAFADPENEGKILEAFSHLIHGKTVMVIAHRLNTVVNADQILYIEDGRIAERGRHEELLSMKGKYAAMWEKYEQTLHWGIRR
jgi:ABC transporter, permease/ATP-binding protein